MENKFCYLKGIVECDSGRIQDCNNKRTATCQLEQDQMEENNGTKANKKKVKTEINKQSKIEVRIDKDNHANKKEHKKGNKAQAFCYLKGLVDCSAGRVQDCNIKRVEQCPLD